MIMFSNAALPIYQPSMPHIPEDGLDLEVGVDEAAGGADHAGGERAAHADLADELVNVGREPERHGPVRVQLPAHVVHVKLGIKSN